MNPQTWTQVDDYFAAHLLPHDPQLAAALAAADAAGLPPINVAPNQGKLLALLVQLMGANRVLEVGTLGGYSTLWMARALPTDGHLVTLEIDPHHARVAQSVFDAAGVSEKITLRQGRAVDTLAQMIAQGEAPFDLVFIDADKPSNVAYFEAALALTHSGSLILIDNVVRSGEVVDAESQDDRVQGVRRLMERIAVEPRVSATALQTVGSKGYDGLAVIRVV